MALVEEKASPSPPLASFARQTRKEKVSSVSTLCSSSCCLRLPKSDVSIHNMFKGLEIIDEEIDDEDFPEVSGKVDTKHAKKMPKLKKKKKKKKKHPGTEEEGSQVPEI